MNVNQVTRYSVGFIGSIVLTVVAYLLVTQSSVMGMPLIIAISVLAIIQLVVQLVCFLHLGDETNPRWRVRAFIAMTGSLLLIVIGSIWIMKNLDYNMMPAHETDAHMMEERDKGF